MYYRDIILAVQRSDQLHFMRELVTILHEKHDQHQCALSFPQWKEGTPNRMDTVDPYVCHAELGTVVRLFSATEAPLEAIERVLEIEAVVRAGHLQLTQVKRVPTGCSGAAFCRVRSADGLNRRLRRAGDADRRQRLRDDFRAQGHKLAHLQMLDKHGRTSRPLYLTKVSADQVSQVIQTNSFGLSPQKAPCFLPDF
ncbi:type I-F CRISPR-associated endoribonuclease Cas6/Csy4 [Burkholderia multivorans]|uniref:type I-F CRISPR-associated endoribonuclease Cas6/Csy4 n=1 Tax=Burkholderia multivorans TaxID=87883 RepID=UPI001C214960|nr:type I-F CRISPR-associated endoribonuclease Cas6/Csy4 [Burkholderia multivorans]MBU9200174.1 type I-F CRISPR-associated endoribonuclease Cas6/Csy4 [Burkholderia multivorans]MDN8078704.1 type I-F CRISPR-associated endoribonuclease Cas6/Csy4 [Burkholderia multivorans]